MALSEIADRLDGAAIRRLASQIRGQVITPETPVYESSRLVFNRAFDRRPALIVRCAGAPDVARALEFAQNQNLRLAVRGGVHSCASRFRSWLATILPVHAVRSSDPGQISIE